MRGHEVIPVTLQSGFVAAGTDHDVYFTLKGTTGDEYEIQNMELVPGVTQTASATDYTTWTLVNVTQSNEVIMDHATQTAQEGTLTIATAVQTTVPTTGAQILTVGDLLRLRCADTGSGVAKSAAANLWLKKVRQG